LESWAKAETSILTPDPSLPALQVAGELCWVLVTGFYKCVLGSEANEDRVSLACAVSSSNAYLTSENQVDLQGIDLENLGAR